MTAPNSSQTAPEGGSQGGTFDADAAAQQALADAARQGQGEGDDDDEDGDGDWTAESARRAISKRNKENQKLREQLRKLQPLADQFEQQRQANQTELEKAQEKASALEVRIAELTATNTRREAAEAAGLASQFVKFITAVEPDEALAQAKELAKALKAASGEDKRADMRQGPRGSNSTGSQMTNDDLLRAMARQR